MELSDLKPGDDVLEDPGGIASRTRITKVTRVTAKQIIVGRCRYWKEHGREVGSRGWSRGRIRIPTEADHAEIRKLDAERKRRDMVRALYEHINRDLAPAHDHLVAACKALGLPEAP